MPKTKKTTPSQATPDPAGRLMRKWLDSLNTSEVAPVAHEMLETAARLDQIRAEMAKPGLSVMDLAHLISAENRVQQMFARLWRLSGSGDIELPKLGDEE